MKKRIRQLPLALIAAVLLSGCSMRTVDQMYRVPKRSQAFSHVQKAMDEAMVGLEYAAPVSGENQQTVQLADLDGDGLDEYLLFARDRSKTPLEILVFDTDSDGTCFLLDSVELKGSVFERVEYVDVDTHPGRELVVGCQVSDQLMGNVTILSFHSGSAEKLMSTSYSRFLTCDLNQNACNELLVLRPSEADTGAEYLTSTGLAMLYEYQDGSMERSVEVPLAAPNENVKRIIEGKLEDESPAVFISPPAVWTVWPPAPCFPRYSFLCRWPSDWQFPSGRPVICLSP